jgi:ATP-dependent Clp protease ATP-binding subunit ClpB
MTSNIGSSYLLENSSTTGIDENIRNRVMNDLKSRFKPEFLNRLDDIIMFKPLTNKEITKIIDIFLKDINNRLKDRNISLVVTEEAKELMAKEGYDPVYGARPLKRYIENTLETDIAKKIIKGDIYEGCTVGVDVKGDNITIERINK